MKPRQQIWGISSFSSVVPDAIYLSSIWFYWCHFSLSFVLFIPHATLKCHFEEKIINRQHLYAILFYFMGKHSKK